MDDNLHYTFVDPKATEGEGLDGVRSPMHGDTVHGNDKELTAAPRDSVTHVDPRTAAAWHARARQILQPVEESTQTQVSEAEPLPLGDTGPPSRQQLVSLVSGLQEQITRAREKQEELTDALHLAQQQRMVEGTAHDAPTAPPAVPYVGHPGAPRAFLGGGPPVAPRAFLGGASRSAAWPSHLAVPQLTPMERFHGQVGAPPMVSYRLPASTADPVSMYASSNAEFVHSYTAAGSRPPTAAGYAHMESMHQESRSQLERQESRVQADERLKAALASPYRQVERPASHKDPSDASPRSVVAHRHFRAPAADEGSVTPPRRGLPAWGSSPAQCSTSAAKDDVPLAGAPVSASGFAFAPLGAQPELSSTHDVMRLMAQLATLRAAVERAEERLREEMAARLEAERFAAAAARSSAAASRSAEELRSQLHGARQQEADAQRAREVAEKRASALEGELTSLRMQMQSKQSEERELQHKVAKANAAAAQRERQCEATEAEMRKVRQRALAMVQAMRGTAASLSAHSQAHAILEGHFSTLESSLRAAAAPSAC